MRLQLFTGLLGLGLCCTSACTLTESEYHPIKVDSVAPSADAVPPTAECGVNCATTTRSDDPASSAGDPAGSVAVSTGDGEASPESTPRDPADPTSPAAGSQTTTDSALPETPSADAGVPDASPRANAAAPSSRADAGAALVSARGLIGWAAVSGLGTPTTTGGAAGATVSATTAAELSDFAARPEPLTIEITGTLRVPQLNVASNKTLRGIGAAARLEGGLRIRGTATAFVKNIIVQNLNVDGSFSTFDDSLEIRFAHHVWVDHCDLHDAPDGNLDIVHGSDFVTASWNRFSYATNSTNTQRQSSLIGNSDTNAAEDAGHLRVTLHHNFWQQGILGSMPRVRFGEVHVFNNYYASAPTDAAITAAFRAQLLVENNFFDGVATPTRIVTGSTPAPELRAIGNAFAGTAPAIATAGNAFVPPYAYVADVASGIPEQVGTGSGPTANLDPSFLDAVP
jgi:pectate lyase